MAAAPALAGPPLVTDDTGVLAAGGWETIVYAAGDQRDAGDSFELPGLEVSYGLDGLSQATVAFARIENDPAGSRSRSGFGALTLEYKRILHAGEQTAVAIVPAYSFPVTGSSADRGLIDDVRTLDLPVVASWESGRWTLTGQVAYSIASSGPNGTFVGAWAGYGITDRLQALVEVYRSAVVGEDEDETNWTAGFEFAVTDGVAVLASVGGGLSSDLAPADELDSTFFIGLRYETP